MTFDVSVLTAGLERGADDIWFAPRRTPVSYPEHGNAACLQFEDRSFWFRHRNRCITTLVRRFAPKGVLLDVGGGNGYVAKGLMDAGIECALLEPGLEGVLAARARGVGPVICARLEDLDVAGAARSSIGAAGMFDVLEHIEDEAVALRQVHALLRPAGLLFLTVPAYAFLHSTDDFAAGHFRRYTLPKFQARVLHLPVRTAAARRPDTQDTAVFAGIPQAVPCRATRDPAHNVNLERGVTP